MLGLMPLLYLNRRGRFPDELLHNSLKLSGLGVSEHDFKPF